MSILDVTEEQVFRTLGRGRDPNFKPIEKKRTAKQNISKEPVRSPEVETSIMQITENLCELNMRLNNIQKMVKWYVVPQFTVVVVLLVIFLAKM